MWELYVTVILLCVCVCIYTYVYVYICMCIYIYILLLVLLNILFFWDSPICHTYLFIHFHCFSVFYYIIGIINSFYYWWRVVPNICNTAIMLLLTFLVQTFKSLCWTYKCASTGLEATHMFNLLCTIKLFRRSYTSFHANQ